MTLPSPAWEAVVCKDGDTAERPKNAGQPVTPEQTKDRFLHRLPMSLENVRIRVELAELKEFRSLAVSEVIAIANDAMRGDGVPVPYRARLVNDRRSLGTGENRRVVFFSSGLVTK